MLVSVVLLYNMAMKFTRIYLFEKKNSEMALIKSLQLLSFSSEPD